MKEAAAVGQKMIENTLRRLSTAEFQQNSTEHKHTVQRGGQNNV